MNSSVNWNTFVSHKINVTLTARPWNLFDYFDARVDVLPSFMLSTCFSCDISRESSLTLSLIVLFYLYLSVFTLFSLSISLASKRNNAFCICKLSSKAILCVYVCAYVCVCVYGIGDICGFTTSHCFHDRADRIVIQGALVLTSAILLMIQEVNVSMRGTHFSFYLI